MNQEQKAQLHDLPIEDQILGLANQKAVQFLQLEPEAKGFNPGLFDYVMKQAIVGFRFMRERLLLQRAERDQQLRAIRYAFNDPARREEYIRSTMPKLLQPAKK